MMMFMDKDGNRTEPPNGWNTGGGDVLSPVRGGPWGTNSPQAYNSFPQPLNQNRLGSAQPAMMSNEAQTHSLNNLDPNNPLAQFLSTYNQNQNGGSNVASQLPAGFNPAFFAQPMAGAGGGMAGGSGGGMLSSMPPPQGGMQTGVAAMNPQFQMMNSGQMGGTQTGVGSMNPQFQMMGRNQPAIAQLGGGVTGGSGEGETSWWDTFKGQLPGIGEGLAAGASIAGALKAADNTTATGHAMQDYLSDLGDTLNTGSQFQGYGVSTGLGSGGTVGYDDEGKLDINLGMENPQDSAAALNSTTAFTNSNDAMKNAMADPSMRQGEIYEQMMAAQRPELNRMQSEQQAQEYARGRGGVRGSQYGGTAEDAAMARARVQGSAEAQMGAMKQADAERSMFGQMAGQFGQMGNQQLQASFLPMQQQIEAMKLGMANADMAQTGQLTGQDYMAQLGLGGANANINAQHSANQLTGNLYNALLANIGGTQGSDGSAGSGLMGLIGGGIKGIGDYFGWGDDEDGGT